MVSADIQIHAVAADDRTDALAEVLADILIDCVDGGASVTFLAPLARDTALAYWRGVIASAQRNERVLLVAGDGSGRIHGTVQIIFAPFENQRHRGELAKLLVHRRARRLGLGAALVRAAEDAARRAGRTLLILDTVTGSEGDRLYARLGWQRLGSIPDYALGPDRAMCAATYFYKNLQTLR